MAKTSSYPDKSNPSLSDRVGGNDSENNQKFVNFTIESIVSLVNSISGKDYIQYKFSPNYGSIGLFSSNEAITNPTQITKLFFNKQSVSKEDLTALFTKLDTLQNIVIDLRNPSNSNNFATFKITNITNQTEYFELDVTLFKNFYSGNIVANTTYSAYFDVKENFEDKLDQGNYVGTAETLKADIETRQLKVAGKSLVDDTEITKLSHLDDTTDLQKPISTDTAAALALKLAAGGYVGTAQDLENAITAAVTGVTGQALVPSSPAFAGTGIASGIALEPGTYTNLGGVVVNSNSIAVIARDALGAYSITQTTLVLTGYVQESDIIDALDSTATDKPVSANSVRIVAEKVSEVENKEIGEYNVTDEDGNVVFKIDNQGVKAKKYNICNSLGVVLGTIDEDAFNTIISMETLVPAINMNERYNEEYYITDENDNVILKYTEEGFDVAKLSTHFKSLLSSSSNNGFVSVGNFIDDINLNIIYGQSLAVGGTTISAENFLTSKMFANGVLIDPPADSDINSKSYNETYFGDIVNMSTTGSGLNARMMSKKWNELIISEDGIDLDTFAFNLMGLVAGISGGAWFQLNKQNISIDSTGWATVTSFAVNNVGRAYCNLLHGVYFARERAHAQGKSLNVNTLSWVQGEATSDYDDTITQYYDKLVAIFTDLNNDIKIITGQTNDVEFIIYQNSSFSIYQVPTSPNYVSGLYTEGVPLACLKVANDLPNVTFATPLYPFSVSQATSDKLHLSNVGYAIMSSLFGITAKRVVTDKKSLKAFYPNSVTSFSDGTNYFVKVKFDVPQKPIVFDISGDDGNNMLGHGLQENYGFSIKTGGGTEIITSVRKSGNDSIVIGTSTNPDGLDLTYAWTGVLGGGNVRDSQGDTITTTFNGITYRCDNWLPFFRITI